MADVLYQPQYRVTGTTTWTSFGSEISTTSTTITSLPSGTSYDIQVLADLGFGQTTASNIITVSTTSTQTLTGITLSTSSFSSSALAGSTVATIAVQTTGATFAGSLALSGTNASYFAISGSNLILSSAAGYKATGSQVIIDSYGNTWSIVNTNNGQVTFNGTTDTTTSFVTMIGLINNTIYQFNGSSWYSKAVIQTVVQGNWNGPVTAPTFGIPAGTYSVNVIATASGASGSPYTKTFSVASSGGSRNFADNPGADGSFWLQPFYTSAKFITSGSLVTSLRNGIYGTPTGAINLKGNYSPPWVKGTASDPLVTVTNGTKSIQVRVPIGTIVETPTSGVDQSIGGADMTQPYLVWSISGATINTGSITGSTSVITGTYGMQVDSGAGWIMCDAQTGQPGTNNSIGGITDYELTQALSDANYVIGHMLAFQLDPRQASSGGPIWPLKVIDGGATWTGTIPQGTTIGIPASTTRPTGQSRGFYLLFDNLQQFGWLNYNFGGAGCTFITCYSNLSANSALVTDLVNSISAVMAYVGFLDYTNGNAGAQYSLATMKGFVTGATNAFPAPPLLDLSATGGVAPSPSSFQAWYPSGFNSNGPT